MINRNDYLQLIQAALIAGRPDFARNLAADWLDCWGGDLEVQLYFSRAEVEEKSFDSAMKRTRGVIQIDPENIAAYEELARITRSLGLTDQSAVFQACARLLQGRPLEEGVHPAWVLRLGEAKAALERRDFDLAVQRAMEALTADPGFPLPTLYAMRAHLAAGNRPAAIALAQAGHDRWPDCTPFLILLADDLFNQGSISRGVEYLHRASSFDIHGSTASELLGSEHPYRDLWPDDLSIPLSRPLPAEVAAVLGGNRLGAGSDHLAGEDAPPPSSAGMTAKGEPVGDAPDDPGPTGDPSPDGPAELPLPQPEPWEAFRGPNSGEIAGAVVGETAGETLQDVQEEFLRLAERINARRQPRDEDGRSPAYIILTSRTRLTQKFGESEFDQIDDAIIDMVESVRRRPGWSAYRIYPDDPSTLEHFGLSPIDPGNAWQVKLRLADLDRALGKRGEMIGALFIIGGADVIPFHMLPNPTDDDDEVVHSDNPYATSDENYFAPEWPIGRLPSGGDSQQLIRYLEKASRKHAQTTQTNNIILRMRFWFADRFRRLVRNSGSSMGYTASIWRKASLAVFKAIGEPGTMITSPPTEASRLPSLAMRPVNLSYYNLHGLEDAPEWYGQRDPLRDTQTDVEFPVALRPSDVVNGGRAPRIVFTEACYGANILGKSIDDALSLKFLDSGTNAVIGSTRISYGSVTPPLIAADLLGRLFWQNINQQIPVGEALRRAKLQLAAEMHRRQGFLDGEDQKTLISFVLYGDPMFLPLRNFTYPGEKSIIRRRTRPQSMKTACALGGTVIQEDELPEATLEKVNLIVKQYLPGMADAVCTIHTQQCQCDGVGHTCPTHQLSSKKTAENEGNTTVITLSKHIPAGNRRHPHFARLTLDSSGKVMKLAVSR
jgi:tetratricopeptide (TPR) repeat protein